MRISSLINPFCAPVLAFVIALVAQDACVAGAVEPGVPAMPAEPAMSAVPAATKVAPYRLDTDIPGECERLSRLSYPPQDQPTAAQAQNLQGCEAYEYYYGIGRARDYVKARQCAFSQPAPDSGVSGEVILMMLYANGQGVPRNPEIAKKAACSSGLSGDDLKESIVALRKMQTPAMRTSKTFDFCDVANSERSADLCYWVKSQVDIRKYESQLASKRRTWTRLQQSAFDELQKKWKVYIDFHADLEARRVGSDAAIHRRAVVAGEKSQFLESLLDFETGKYPTFGEEAYKAIDSNLNEKWRAQITPAGLPENQTVEGMRRTQRAWLAYRESWVKFAAYRYGRVLPDAWRAYFTQGRIIQLGWGDGEW